MSEGGIESRLIRLGGDAMLPNAFSLARQLKTESPDALLLTTFKKFWLGGMAGRIARVPRIIGRVAVSSHRAKNFTYTIPIRNFLHAVVANANGVREPLAHSVDEVSASKIITVYDGVPAPTPKTSRVDHRASLGIPADAPLIGSVGRLSPQKRFDRLVHAFALLRSDAHLLVLGEGPERASLEQLSTSLGLSDRAHFPGHSTDVADALNALDVFVVSSDFEGLSNAMLEAMALGVPVISTPVSGAIDALEALPDGASPGIITDPDAQSLAGAMTRLMSDSAERERIAAAGLRRIRERFGFDRMLDEWEALCRSA